MKQFIYSIFCLALVPLAEAQQRSPEALFRQWDKNKDGKLLLAELPQNARRNFSRVDTNKDGAISLEEHVRFLKRPRNAQPPQFQGVKVLRNIPYASTDNPRQMLDLILPDKREGKEPLPVIAFIHGGGWRNGNKSSGINRVAGLVKTGRYVGVSIGYRLSGEAIWPAQIHDCKAAIRWLRGHAKEHGIDPDRIAVWGSSAGGHLVSMLGVTGGVSALEGKLGKHGNQSSRVQAVVNYYGPSALLLMNSKPSRIDHDAKDSPESMLVGAPIQKAKEKTRQASPLTHVSADDAPHLHVHGTKDPLVPFHQSQIYHGALKKADVESTLITVKDGGHNAPRDVGENQVRLFLRRHLYKKGKQLSDETVPVN
jgi:acetyl esterase/lipase